MNSIIKYNKNFEIQRQHKIVKNAIEISLLVILFISLPIINAKLVRYHDAFYIQSGQISLTINGRGKTKILNENFTPRPSKVSINNIIQNETNYIYNFNESSNNVILYYGDTINSFENMFSDLTSIAMITFQISGTCVSNFNSMFSGCTGLTSIIFHSLPVCSTFSADYLFKDCTKLTTISLPFSTLTISSMIGMFMNCESLTSIQNLNFDINQEISMEKLFKGCSTITSINLSSLKVGYVTDSSYMFDGCTKLNSIITFNNYFYPYYLSPIKMDYMFRKCTSLESIDFSKLKTFQATSMGYIFSGCTNLKVFEYTNFDTTNVKNMSGIFHGCSELTSINMDLFKLDSVETMSHMFEGCSKLNKIESFNNIITISHIMDMSAMFKGCKNLESIDLSKMNTPSLKSMNNMFKDCKNLKFVNFTNFDTSNVVSMIALFKGCNFNNFTLPKINTNSLKNISHMFEDCNNLTSVDFSNFDTSKVKDISYMFSSCLSMTSADFSTMNTSSVEYMNATFKDCINLTTYDFSNLDSSNLKSFDSLFYNCSRLEFIDLSMIKTSSIVNMDYLFSDCSNLKSINLNNIDTSKVTSMNGLFKGCYNLQSLELPNLDTSSLESINGMFQDCEALKTINLNNFDTSKVKDMSNMFKSCTELSTLDLSNLKTDSVENMEKMFEKCNKLISINLSNLNTQNLKKMNNMFDSCTQLTSINFDNFNTTNVRYMSYLFNNCNSLQNLDLSSFDTSSVESMHSMFSGCNQLSALNLLNFDTQNVEDMGEMFHSCHKLSTLKIDNFNTYKVINMGYIFCDCFLLTSINLNNFDISNVNTIEYMFSGCSKLTSINLENFKTSKIKNMQYMFNDCSKLYSLDLSNFETTEVTAMNNMFMGCTNLRYLDINNFDTKNVLNMKYMFCGCENLLSIDLSEIDTSKCNNMEYMFSNCKALKYLNLSNFITSEVTSMNSMFSGCENLLFLDLANFNINSNTNMESMFKNCKSLIYLNLDDMKINDDLDNKRKIFDNIFSDIKICVKTDEQINIISSYNLINNCEHQCFNESSKVLGYKKICVDDCEKDEYYKYEYNKVCLDKCPLGTQYIYQHEYICQKVSKCMEFKTNISYCEEKIPEGYYLDKNDGIYKPCYRRCKTCYGPGNSLDNNCIEYIMDKFLDNLHASIETFNTTDIDNGIDSVFEEEGATFTFTSNKNQKENNYINVSTINLGKCEDNIIDTYNLSKNSTIYILKIDLFEPGALTSRVEYEVYCPLYGDNLTLINLSICENEKIEIFKPINIPIEDKYKYDQKSDFYNDLCNTFTSEKGTDQPLVSRRNDYSLNYLCEEDCEFEDFIYFNNNTQKAKCSCLMKINLPLLSEIKIDKKKLLSNFKDIKNIINIKLLSCTNLLLDISNIFKNSANYILIFLFIISIISIIFFICHTKKNIKHFIKNLLIERKIRHKKEKKNLTKEQIINSKNKKSRKDNSKNLIDFIKSKVRKEKNSKNKNYSKKELNRELIENRINKRRKSKRQSIIIKNYNINTVNNYDLSNCNSTLNVKRKKKHNITQRKNSIFRNNNTFLTSLSQNNNNNIINKDKKTEKHIRYNDREMNLLSYKKAIKYDHRKYFQYYISLLKMNHILIFTFFNFNDYNSRMIKIYIFFFNFLINYAISAMFYSDDTMDKIYQDEGSFDIIYQIPNMIYSSLITFILVSLITMLGLFEENILKIKNCRYHKLNKTVMKEMRYIQIKIILFFIITYILLFALYIYTGCFCAVYKNTQIHLIKEVISSFIISLITPFIIYLIPGIFRIPALINKNRETLYKFSKFVQRL